MSVWSSDDLMVNQVYSIDYFLAYFKQINANSMPGKNINWIVREKITRGLSKNPNLKPYHLECMLADGTSHTYQNILKIILKRKDKLAFIDQIFSIIDTTDDNLTIYFLGTWILFDDTLQDFHERAMKALVNLKYKRTYNVHLKQYLIGPCLPYKFFIREMLSNVKSVEDAKKWLDEYNELEEQFLLSNSQVYCTSTEDPIKQAKYLDHRRKQDREEMYRALVSNQNMPFDCLKKFFDFADTIDDESYRISFWGLLLSNPNITPEAYREIFETKKGQLKNKGLINSLYGSLAANPEHFSIYLDNMIKYVSLKPTIPRYGILRILIRNPGVGKLELDRIIDIISKRDYGPDTKDLKSIVTQTGWSLKALLERTDLSEEHHAKIRYLVIQFLDLITSEEFNRKHNGGKMHANQDYLDNFCYFDILSKVRLDKEFVDKIFNMAKKKDNVGLLLSGLLPNSCLTQEQYDQIVTILEDQYIGKESKILLYQHTQFFAEKVYELWPASIYVG